MKAGLRDGDLWPLAKDEKGFVCEAPLPTARVERYLDRLHPGKRANVMARLRAEGYLPPCPIVPRVLFANDLQAIPQAVVASALVGWVRQRPDDQAKAAKDLEAAP